MGRTAADQHEAVAGRTRTGTSATPAGRSAAGGGQGQLLRMVPAVVLAIAVGLGAGVFFGGLVVIERDFLILIAGGIGAAALGLLAAVRFEWFVWTALALRTSLDMVAGPGLGAGAMLAALFMLLASVWLVVQYRSGNWHRLSIASKALLALSAVGALSMVTSVVPMVTAAGSLEVLAGALMFPVLEQLLRERPDRLRRLLTAVFLSMIVPIATGLEQWLTGHNYSQHTSMGRIQGSFVHPNPYATYLVTMLVFAAGLALATRGWRRNGLVALSAVLGLLVVVTYARAGWIAAVVGLGYLGLRKSRKLAAVLAVVLIGVALFVPSVNDRIADVISDDEERYLPVGVPGNSFEWRLQYWESLLPLAADSPVTGIGLNAVLEVSDQELEPHNVFVQALVEMGLLGLTALVLAIVAVGVTLHGRRRESSPDTITGALSVIATAAALALLVQAPSGNLLTQAMAYWYFAAASAWGYAQLRRTAPVAPRLQHA